MPDLIPVIDQATATGLMAYLDTFSHGSGTHVIADLRLSLHDKAEEIMADELADIPHPYQAYVIMGLRMAYMKIILALETAEQIRAGEIEVIQSTEEENHVTEE